MRSLELAVKYLAGERLIGTAAERAALTTSSTVTSNTSWKELPSSRTIVTGSAASSLATPTFAEKDNLMFMYHIIASGATVTGLHFNTDNSSENYSTAISTNGSANSGDTTQDTLVGIHPSTSYEAWGYGFIRNKLSGKKTIQIYSMSNNATGTSGVINNTKYFGSWNPDTASERISKMTLTTSGSNLGVGTEIVVLGFDDDETATTGASASPSHTDTNFWQQIGKDDLDSGSGTLDVTISSPKKYMMVQYHCIPDGNIDVAARVGISGSVATTDSYYRKQECDNYGTFQTDGTAAPILPWGKGSGGTYDATGIGYMVNKDGSEKMWLAVGQDNGGDGAGNVGAVRENSGKFITTSGLVNIFQLFEYGQSGQLGSGTEVTVWGSD